MNALEDFYVYCYIDPRNLEEFYYGKGTGNRSKSHLLDLGKSEKAARIKAIRDAGEEPTVRIIATDLTEDQAFWTEAALLWKLGKRLTNKNRGRDVAKFRPQDTLHTNLVGFDFSARIHYFDVGQPWRSWDDCRKHGFLSAGWGVKWANQVRQLHKSDVVVAYLRKHGYVGLGRVTAEAVPARDFRIGNKMLEQCDLNVREICHDSDDLEKCEYIVKLKWLIAKRAEEAIWKPKYGLFAVQHVRASLANQPKTIRFIEREWGIKFDRLLKEEKS